MTKETDIANIVEIAKQKLGGVDILSTMPARQRYRVSLLG